MRTPRSPRAADSSRSRGARARRRCHGYLRGGQSRWRTHVRCSRRGSIRSPATRSLSGEQPPRIALVPRTGRDPAIIVMWTAKDTRRNTTAVGAFRRCRQVIRVAGSRPRQRGARQPWLGVHCHKPRWRCRRALAGSSRDWPARREWHVEESCGASAPGIGSEAGGWRRASAALEADCSIPSGLGTNPVCDSARLAHRRRLLLLQDRNRHGLQAASTRRGVMCTRETFATLPSRSPRMEVVPSRHRCASAMTTGCSTAAPRMDRPWRLTTRNAFTWSGRHSFRARQPASEPTLALFYAMSSDGRRFTTAAANTHARRSATPSDHARAHRRARRRMGRTGQRHATRLRWLVEQSTAKGGPRFVRQQIGDTARALSTR